jgi:hypothetical protein
MEPDLAAAMKERRPEMRGDADVALSGWQDSASEQWLVLHQETRAIIRTTGPDERAFGL